MSKLDSCFAPKQSIISLPSTHKYRPKLFVCDIFNVHITKWYTHKERLSPFRQLVYVYIKH